MHTKKTILIFCDWFYPAFKAGGPITSVKNFVDHLNQSFNIFIVTSAYDLGAEQVVPAHKTNQWNKDYNPNVSIKYLDKHHLSKRKIQHEINEIKPDFIYLNSFFSKTFTIYPLLCKTKDSKVILAPRGMLGSHSLSIKPLKKKIFILLSKLFKIHKNVVWQATSSKEANEIKVNYSKHITLFTASNFSKYKSIDTTLPYKNFSNHTKRFLFVGRMNKIKNLDGFLKILSSLSEKVQGSMELTIIGPNEDPEYHEECLKLSGKLSLYSLKWIAELPPEELKKHYERTHFYVSTSHHENFGHSIAEALSYGCIPFVSTNTPWRNLQQQNIGWDIDLANLREWKENMEKAVQLDELILNEMSENAITLMDKSTQHLRADYLKIFSH